MYQKRAKWMNKYLDLVDDVPLISHTDVNIIEVKENTLDLIKHGFDFPQILKTKRLIRR